MNDETAHRCRGDVSRCLGKTERVFLSLALSRAVGGRKMEKRIEKEAAGSRGVEPRTGGGGRCDVITAVVGRGAEQR